MRAFDGPGYWYTRDVKLAKETEAMFGLVRIPHPTDKKEVA